MGRTILKGLKFFYLITLESLPVANCSCPNKSQTREQGSRILAIFVIWNRAAINKSRGKSRGGGGGGEEGVR